MLKNKKKKTEIPFRINILFFIVFLSFSVLIIQLGIVQILHGEAYQAEIDKTIQDTTKTPVPRGKIYDRQGRVVVDNKAMYSITYTPPKNDQADSKLKLAEDLVEYMSIEDEQIDRLTTRNKKEYWYLKNQEEAESRVTEKESELSVSEQYQIALDRITEEEISHFTETELKVIAIKRELDKAYALTPQVIKNSGITPEEYAKIAEHLGELPGINVSSDWERELKFNNTLQSIIGNVSTQDQGIPSEGAETFLSKGYNRNDRVGRSGLESYYEDVLRGRKEHIQLTTTKSGRVIGSEVIVPGERGKDLYLTIDMDFQETVDKILLEELQTVREMFPVENQYVKDALAVVMNPKTGEILALSGQHYNEKDDEFESSPFKTIYDAHLSGSSIKGATILAGLDSGTIQPGQSFYDRPIKMAETPLKGSYRSGLGTVNDISSIKVSSNVYMYYVALKMIGEHRYPFPNNGRPTFNREGFQTFRNYFNQLGLGVSTGIDFPSEATGFTGTDPLAGNVLDYAIGQYDTYTTLQLAQYISTIANGGYRLKPKLVNEIRNPSNSDEPGSIYQVNETKILNELDVDKRYIERVQEGFWKAFNEPGGTGYSHWANKDYNPAGKTGTAENFLFENGKLIAETQNVILVGYGPADDAEVAFAVIVPHLGASVRGQYPVNHRIATRIMDEYFSVHTVSEDEDE